MWSLPATLYSRSGDRRLRHLTVDPILPDGLILLACVIDRLTSDKSTFIVLIHFVVLGDHCIDLSLSALRVWKPPSSQIRFNVGDLSVFILVFPDPIDPQLLYHFLLKYFVVRSRLICEVRDRSHLYCSIHAPWHQQLL